MPPRRLVSLIRFGYHHLYNRFAFTYDAVSAVVSRGEWREWTRAAIPFVRGPRILEIAFGTGDLQLDLATAGYQPFGVDLSPYMAEITRQKLRGRGVVSRLVQATVQAMPFPDACFDSIVMTFPPGFVNDPLAMEEIARVLARRGVLVWVDAPYLYPRGGGSRFWNWAWRVTGGKPEPSTEEVLEWANRLYGREATQLSAAPGWEWRTEKIELANSYVHVMAALKIG